ncbi:MAG TPA: murein biosynthesis integral membrane protein MurJ [Acidimicrobiales bacterium]|nr:murein biosynthesis integral membrane protein MurJ [Acidimicrobiales bacterium]
METNANSLLKQEKKKPSNTQVVALGIFLSRISGLIRESLLRSVLALGPAADAFAAALRIPNLLQNLLGEGTLSASFIPVYSQLLGEDGREEASKAAGATLGLLSAISGFLVLLGVLAARPIAAILAPGFDNARFELTVDLLRITFIGIGALVLSAWCLGVLNSHRKFFLSYVAPVLWNIAQIVVLVFVFTRSWNVFDAATAVAWGLVAGGILQFSVQLVAVWKIAPDLRPTVNRSLPHVVEIRRRFLPAVAGRGVVQISAYVDLFLASLLSTGAVATLLSAQVLYLLPISLFVMSVAASELPEMSRTGLSDELTDRSNSALRKSLFFIFFTAAIYMSAGEQIIDALFGWGSFSSDDASTVWMVLSAYSLGLPAVAASRLLQTSCWSLGNTKGPAQIAGIRVLVASLVGLALMFPLDLVAFDQGGFTTGEVDGPHLGAVGLALGSAVASWLEVFLLSRVVRQSLPGLQSLKKLSFQIGVPAALTFLLAAVFKFLTGSFPSLLMAPMIVGISGLFYTFTAFRSGVTESHLVLSPIRRMLHRG